MEVSGQKHAKGKEMKLCNFCEDFEVTTYADGFCVECEVFTCNNCFVKHKGRKATRDHNLVNVEDSHSAKAIVNETYEACEHHKGKSLEIYCSNHDQVCCGECIVSNHHGCKLELIRNKAASFHKSLDFNNVTTMIKNYDQQAQACATSIEKRKEQLPSIYEKFICDVNAYAEKVIERVTRMKETLLIQAKDVMLKAEQNFDKLQKETEEVIAELSRQNDLLKSKMDQPNKLFVVSVGMKPELSKIEQQLKILQEKNIVTRYTFKRDKVLERAMKEMKRVGLLQEEVETVKQKEELKTTDKSTASMILEKKQQLLLDRQLFGKNINVDGDILSYSPNEENKIGLYVDNRPLRDGSYFEIEVVSIGSRGAIALGFVRGDRSNLPGVEEDTLGYYSDGRILYSGLCQGNATNWKVGDKIGLRITNDINYGLFNAQFTHNGKYSWSGSCYGYGSHFAVGMSSPGDKVKVIFE